MRHSLNTEGNIMKYALLTVAFCLVAGPASARICDLGLDLLPGAIYCGYGAPSPEMDLGLASIVMVAGAAFATRLRRRRA